MADDLAATLAEAKRDHWQHVCENHPEPGICVQRCAGRWPCGAHRSATSLEAVLKLHQPMVRRQNWPEVCRYDNRRWPCPEVRVITRELTGKEAGDAAT